MQAATTPAIDGDHLVDLTLALLGVIQGLAFSHLAEKLPRSGGDAKPFDRILAWAVYGVCLLIVVRVFQTYALAALQCTASQALEFSDLIGIFLVGLFQYSIFDQIDKHGTNIDAVLVRISILGIGAAVLHAKTGFAIPSRRCLTGDQKHVEVVIECWNVAIAISISLLSFVGGRLIEARRLKLVVTVLIAAALAANIVLSLRLPLGRPATTGCPPAAKGEPT